MSVGISIDPLSYIQNDRINRQNRSDQLYQSRADNDFRNMQHWAEVSWREKQREDQRWKLSQMARDAKNAGISLRTALGSGGATPVNISLPQGQGGRVSGTYQRGSPISATATIDTSSEIQKQMDNERLQSLKWDNLNKQTDLQYKQAILHKVHYPDLTINSPPPKYVRYRNNYDEAVGWISEGDFSALNPDMNMEVNESIGGYQFSKPYPEGFLNY